MGIAEYYINLLMALFSSAFCFITGNDALSYQYEHYNIPNIALVHRADYNYDVNPSTPVNTMDIFTDRQGYITQVIGKEFAIGKTYCYYSYNPINKAVANSYYSAACLSVYKNHDINFPLTKNSFYTLSYNEDYFYNGYSIYSFDTSNRSTQIVHFSTKGDTTSFIQYVYDCDTSWEIVNVIHKGHSNIDTVKTITLAKDKNGNPTKTYSKDPFSRITDYYTIYEYTYY